MWAQPHDQFAHLCRHAGIHVPVSGAREAARVWKQHMRDQRELPGPDDWRAADAAALVAGGFVGDVGVAVDQIEAAVQDLRPEWVLDRDVPAILDALAGLGLRIAVVSNWDGTLAERLRTWGLSRHFAYVADSAMVGVAKPAPAIFGAAVRELGIQAHETLHVGDRPDTDVAGALAAGANPVLFDPLACGPTPGGHPRITRLLDVLALVAPAARRVLRAPPGRAPAQRLLPSHI